MELDKLKMEFERLLGCPLSDDVIAYARRTAPEGQTEKDKLPAGYSWLITDYLIVIGCLPPQEVCEGFRAALDAGMAADEIHKIICSVAHKARHLSLDKGGQLVLEAMRAAWRKGKKTAAP